MALVECKVCGEKISDKAFACPHCGSVLIENNSGKNNLNLCEECKAEVPADAKVCPACGCPVNVINETVYDDNSKNKKSIIKKWWFWCLLIFVLFFIFAISGDDEASETADSVENNIESDSEVEETTLTSEIESQITAVDFYKWIDENDTSMEYSVPEKAIAFMKEHPEFFPGNENNTGAMSDYVDYEVTYQHITKSPSKYNDKLISINGIGPKAALSILSVIKVEDIVSSAISGNYSAFESVPGIGKKTAQRIALELKEKITADDFESLPEGAKPVMNVKPMQEDAVQEALLALQSLGYSNGEATKALNAVRNQSDKADELVRLALRSMM